MVHQFCSSGLRLQKLDFTVMQQHGSLCEKDQTQLDMKFLVAESFQNLVESFENQKIGGFRNLEVVKG